ncbi:bet1-like SNARE 1-2 isoform X3 [Lycium ferocissimum]|uniref:bet1-like SNARE 1-2 isoform X3 n=1 Tax=Lycium ferocissimum TaxID=112874 RepID=UPI002815D6C9|nr:bet1-like SNARE 1-2 isoform X3 [Lycium ferocissimum]
MSYRRDHRAHRAALFDNYDNIEEGGIRASSSYPRDIDERDNDKAVDSLQDRVSFLKKLTGDIHEEVETHNRMLDRTGNEMDSSRGIMSGTMDRFKMVSHVFHVWLRQDY